MSNPTSGVRDRVRARIEVVRGHFELRSKLRREVGRRAESFVAEVVAAAPSTSTSEPVEVAADAVASLSLKSDKSSADLEAEALADAKLEEEARLEAEQDVDLPSGDIKVAFLSRASNV